MIAVAFRFENTEWVGLAFAANMRELFWQIDYHGDPHAVEIMRLKSGSVCINQKLNHDIEDGHPEVPDEVEWSDCLFDAEWKLPKWPHDIYNHLVERKNDQ